MASRVLPTIDARALHIDTAQRLRDSIPALYIARQFAHLDVGASIRRSLPRLTVSTIPTIPTLKGLTYDR